MCVALALHLPFVARYDLHFQPDFAISVLMAKSVLDGEHPLFFWGQNYLGTYGTYLTALVFSIFGPSIESAALVSLGIWGLGVALTARLASRLLDRGPAWWAAMAAAVSSPYAVHYVTQPYSSYETAPVLAVLAVAAIPVVARLLAVPVAWKTAAAWLLLGVSLGAALWTTWLFLPVLASVGLAALLRARWHARWQAARVRRAAIALLLVAAGLGVGMSPEIVFRLQRHPGQRLDEPALFAIASPADMPRRLRLGFEALPAYFNADPVARHPEGITFALALRDRRIPYGSEEHRPGPLARAHDVGVRVLVLGILAAAVLSAVRAWKERNLQLLAVCLVPFVHLALIAMSEQTAHDPAARHDSLIPLSEQMAHYFGARRYWFGSLLVLALLVGNAVMVAERTGSRTARVAARAAAAMLLVSSVVAQLQLLALPDELADYRAVTEQLRAQGRHAVVMPEAGWIVAGLGLGAIDVHDFDCQRRPPMCARVLGSEHVALVLRRHHALPEHFAIGQVLFIATGDPPAGAGDLQWRTYRRGGGS